MAVLGNLEPRASLPGEIVPGAEFYDYADKYLDDGSQTLVPAPLTAEQSDTVRAMALQVFKVLRCEGLARVDFFFEEHGRGFLCNEVNTMPGFTPISMYPKMWIASGLSYPELIDELVRLAIERHGRQRRNTSPLSLVAEPQLAEGISGSVVVVRRPSPASTRSRAVAGRRCRSALMTVITDTLARVHGRLEG